jgi:hypothetical protein
MPVPFEALIPFGKLAGTINTRELTIRPFDGHVWSYGDIILCCQAGTERLEGKSIVHRLCLARHLVKYDEY